MENNDILHKRPLDIDPADWEKIITVFNPQCHQCGAILQYVTDGHYNFTDEDYELYTCHRCGIWQTTITKGKNDG